MTERHEGLTKLYNRFHSNSETSAELQRLRELHVELDVAVADAYGWRELFLDHDFHETRQGVRFTVGTTARSEILDRLLELNHDESAKLASAPRSPSTVRGRRSQQTSAQLRFEKVAELPDDVS